MTEAIRRFLRGAPRLVGNPGERLGLPEHPFATQKKMVDFYASHMLAYVRATRSIFEDESSIAWILDENGAELLEAAIARGDIHPISEETMFLGPFDQRDAIYSGSLKRALSDQPSRVDARLLIGLGARSLEAEKLARESAARFGISQRGVLWVTDEGGPLINFESALLSVDAFLPCWWEHCVEAVFDLPPVNEMGGKGVQRAQRLCAVDFQQAPSQIGNTLDFWSAWQKRAENEATVAVSRDGGFAPVFVFAGQKEADLRNARSEMRSYVVERMDPARNPYEPLLAIHRLGVLPFGWWEGLAVLFVHDPSPAWHPTRGKR